MRTVLVCIGLLGLAGCGDPDSPETQIRTTIAAIETAAEARDVGDVMAHLSDQFRDSHGRGSEDLPRYLRGYFIANQSIHLLTRVNNLDFPTRDEARANITVGMLGRDSADSWDLAAELREFDVTFMREGGEWKVTYVRLR